MQWLTALLAFATTMLLFAVVVSTMVEMVHRIFRLRRTGLRLMLENLYSRVIEPKLKGAKPTAEKFADIILENRAVLAAGDPEKRGLLSRFFHCMIDSSVVTNIPVEVFTQKLADYRIVGAADTLADEALTDIAQKYEAFGNEMSSFFESRARLFSVGIAFVVAWMFYVQPYNLAVTYLKNPEIAQKVAEMAPAVDADYRAQLAQLEKAVGEGDAAPANTAELRKAVGDLKQAAKDAKAKSQDLMNLGAPIGWPSQANLKPCASWVSAESCKFDYFGQTWTRPTFGDAIWLLFGGLLIGLGAPFWAQAVSELTASRDLTRKITEIVNPESVASGKGLVAHALAPALPATPTSVAAFKVSRAADPTALKAAAEKEGDK